MLPILELMPHAIKTFAATALIAAAAVGCSSPIAGSPNPATSTSGPRTPSAETTDPFASVNQCSLLDQILSGQGFSPAQPTIASSQKSCRADKSTTSDEGSRLAIDVVISLQNGQKYTENITGSQNSRSGKIGERPFLEQREPLGVSGGCQIGMAVGPNARALVIVSAGDDTKVACDKTQAVAVALDAKLPKN